MRDAHPPRDERFDLKHDEGGMIDIEFIVQYLVLRHACAYPQLTANVGNIALLKLCGTLGLIDAVLADDVAAAYRALRRLQHQVRLQGHDNTRVDRHLVDGHPDRVVALWRLCFGLAAG
jgi:glutamate-ammonia-ligase adenylyltransferase